MNEKSKKIAALNDDLRTTFSISKGRIVTTSGIDNLSVEDKVEIFDLIKKFNDFTPGNDPYGEHDFGKVEHNNYEVFWKIDYYSSDLKHHSLDASDPDKTIRLMTIMLTHEY